MYGEYTVAVTLQGHVMSAYVCVCGRLLKAKWCKDPAWLCVCLICLGWAGVGLGAAVVCRPLTSRTTGSIRRSWIHGRGRGGEGRTGQGGREGSGVQNSQRKWRKRNEKSDENEMCLIFSGDEGGAAEGPLESEDWVDGGSQRGQAFMNVWWLWPADWPSFWHMIEYKKVNMQILFVNYDWL